MTSLRPSVLGATLKYSFERPGAKGINMPPPYAGSQELMPCLERSLVTPPIGLSLGGGAGSGDLAPIPS